VPFKLKRLADAAVRDQLIPQPLVQRIIVSQQRAVLAAVPPVTCQ